MTAQQTKFITGVAQGIPNGEAYRLAYPKASVKASESSSTRLLSKDKFKAALREIAEKVAEGSILTVKERQKMMSDIAKANKDVDPNTSIRATDQLNKMTDGFSPERQETEIRVTIGGKGRE